METNAAGPPSAPEPRSAAQLLLALRIEQHEHWQQGQRVWAEDYLRRYPDLAGDPERALDLVYGEFLLREALGEAPTLAEYQRRFPQFAEPLARQVQLHLALGPDSVAGAEATQSEAGLEQTPGPPRKERIPVGSVTELLSIISEFRLLDDRQFGQLSRLAPPEEVGPEALGNLLRERGWLTAFQIEQLLEGERELLVLGQYLLLERLGEGGMGQVFKARHRLMNRIVAVKVIRQDQLAEREAIQRFHREIRAAATLAHPNVVLAHDADQVGEIHYFVMEFVDGLDLMRLMQRRGRLPVGEACDIIRQAALGLQHAHERGLVHRDIKPSNLLLTAREGLVKLLDLGLARWQWASEQSRILTRAGTIMGTPDYMAPEQTRDSSTVDGRADLYSLGCTLYFLLTAEPPFPGGSAIEKMLRHKKAAPRAVEELRQEVPPAVAAIVQRLLAKDPAERYPSAGELIAALQPWSVRAAPAAAWMKAPAGELPELAPTAAGSAVPLRVPGDYLARAAPVEPQAGIPPQRQRRRQKRAGRRYVRLLAAVIGAILLGLLVAWGLSRCRLPPGAGCSPSSRTGGCGGPPAGPAGAPGRSTLPRRQGPRPVSAGPTGDRRQGASAPAPRVARNRTRAGTL